MRPDLFAFGAACAFFGAAIYINIVEQPARLALGPSSMVRGARRYLGYPGLRAFWPYRRCALAHRRGRDSRELALFVLRDGAGEHLVVRDSSGRGALRRSRAHARLGAA
jgi:hypothetical protein